MRTIDSIKQAIRAEFVSNSTLQEMYELDTAKTFDEQFSQVSLEAIFTYIAAFSIWVFEAILQRHKETVSATLEQNVLCSVPWYHAQALGFQLGHYVTFDSETYKYGYATIDKDAQIVKFASIREAESAGVTVLRVYVSKANKQPLNANELSAFTAYIKTIGAAGIHYEIISQPPTAMSFTVQVVRNPMVLGMDGNRLTDGVNTVSDAIDHYLDTIVYGGIFNRTKLVDAIQEADGVEDVILQQVRIGSEPTEGQNIEAPGGSFTHNLYSSVINYTV